MASSAALQPEPTPIVACTISSDVQNFELLIEDMENALGENWGDLTFEDALVFLNQPEAESMEFAAIAMDESDEGEIAAIAEIIKTANSNGIKVILIASDVSPIALHQLLKLGAEEFVPYPLPEGALNDAIERIRAPEPQEQLQPATSPKVKATDDRDAVILAVQGMAGGVGATTLAVNLAWELATVDKEAPPKVCILDLDLQHGSVATYLDLPRREAIFELLSDTESMDADSFMQALITHQETLYALTAPSEMLPLDFVSGDDIQRIIDVARANFDYVVIDMPVTVVQWTEVVLHAAHVYFSPIEIDMRSAQNTLRMIRALKAEDLPVEKLRFALNRAPKFTDMSGKSRAKRMAESLDIDLEIMLPEGGKQVDEAGDHGQPLAITAAKNPLRREIAKLAQSVHERNVQAETAH